MITFKEYINEDIKKPILPEIKPDDIIAYVDKYAHDGSGYTYGMVTEQPRSFLPTSWTPITRPPSGTKIILCKFLGGRAIPRKIMQIT